MARRSGWFRIWVLLALTWSGFAIWKSINPWSVNRYVFPPTSVVGQAAATSYIAKAPSDVDGCMRGSVRREIEPPTVGALHDEYMALGTSQSANANLSAGVNADPNQIADDAILARRFGVSGDTIQANRDYYVQQAKAADAQAASQYVVTGSCVKTVAVVRQASFDLGFVILPPLAIPALAWLLYITVGRVGRWVLAGFQHENRSKCGRTNNKDALINKLADPLHDVYAKEGNAIIGNPHKTTFRWFRDSSPIIWAGIAFIIVVGATLTQIEKDFTHRAMRRILGQSDTDREKSLERKLKSELPKAISPDVSAVDVTVNDKGIHWVYQVSPRKTASISADSINAFLNTLPTLACKLSLVQLMTAKGFQVSYLLVDNDGSPLGSRTVARCM